MEILDTLLFRKKYLIIAMLHVCDVCLSVDTHVLECGHAMASVWRSFRSWLSPSSMGFKEVRFFRVAKPFHWPPDIFPFLKNTYFHFMGIGVSFCTRVWCVCLAPTAREGHQLPQYWRNKWLWGGVWLLGIQLRSSAEAERALEVQGLFQPLDIFLD